MFEQLFDEYNKLHKSKAKLISNGDETIVVELKGRSEARIEKSIVALRVHMEQISGKALKMTGVKKSGSSFLVTFTVSDKGSMDEVLNILRRYEEGTPVRDSNFED